MAKSKTGLLEAGKISVAAYYSGIQGPYNEGGKRWSSKKRGGFHRIKSTLRDKRTGKKFRKYNIPWLVDYEYKELPL